MRICIEMILSMVLFAGITSCGLIKNVYVIPDAYVEEIEGRKWVPTSLPFRIRSLLSGFIIRVRKTNMETDVEFIIKEAKKKPDIIILSPLNDRITPMGIIPDDVPVIIAGASLMLEKRPLYSSVFPDRTGAFKKAGELAGRVALIKEKPGYLLRYYGKEEKTEALSLIEAYNVSTDDKFGLLYDNVPKGGNIPIALDSKAEEASVLLVFLSNLNRETFELLRDMDPLIITEDANNSRAWKNQIIASIEDDQRQMRGVLFRLMKYWENNLELRYTSRLLEYKTEKQLNLSSD